MGGLTHHAGNVLLDWLFGRRDYAPPETLYLGLSRAWADRAGGLYIEPGAPDYARVPVPNALDELLPVDGEGWKRNANTLIFVPHSDWGLIRSVFLADAPRGGFVLAVADVGEALHVAPCRGVLRLPPGCLRLAFDRPCPA